MCGMCGLLRPGGIAPGDGEVVRAMMHALEHRGPDGEGMWTRGEAVLGHRRLAIIDLEGGDQPLLNETGETGVVFNGEIYNFRELRAELQAAGHRFRTRSDTEVIVHGYEEWGDGVVQRLRGMFAFALWDGVRRRMLLARDRMGVKPLYYHVDPAGRIAFASEVKALFADRAVPRALNGGALAEFLAFRAVAGTATLFRDVVELAPGHLMTVEDGRRSIRRWWSPEQAAAAPVSADEAVERGRALLVDAVRARLVSDVELGMLTSGGVDSSLISAIGAELADRPVSTFAVGFADPAYDERPFARRVAARIRSRHHEIVAHPHDMDAEFDRLTWAHDEPLTHPSSIPMHRIFRMAKEDAGVTVLLSGEGADELFGGYAWYGVAQRRERLRRIPGLGVMSMLPGGKMATLRKVLRPDYLLSASAFSDPAAASPLALAGGDPLDVRRGLWPGAAAGMEGMFVYDQRAYLAPLLQRQDRMSMAAGVEARVPFLDHALVEWANALPARTKRLEGEAKGLLKRMAERWLPDEVIRRRKVGFTLPLRDWLREGGPLGHRVQRLRDPSSPVRTVVDGAATDRLVREHQQNRADHADLLWTLIALDGWMSVFLDGPVRRERLPGAATGLLPSARPAAAAATAA
jgi:asparagine synthase (glutamine-hydrolysing)